ncbi:putative ribonuclease H-like domain-containing protein, partial [Tanacetum coccineum]
MDLFGPTSVKSINHASYCLVITDDCTRFCWVFFLASKDETSGIIQTFIRQIENQLSHRVKIIRSDNGTEFKNRYMLEFCGNKGIKQEYSNARTPQQNGVAERMNRTLIEAARTMLADSLLPTTFWAEAKKLDSLYQQQEAGSKTRNDGFADNVMGYILGEHTEAEEIIMHLWLSAQAMRYRCEQEAQILAYTQAVKKLEAQLVTSQKQHISLNEKLAFQANEIHEKYEKLKRYRRIRMKAVKEKEQLQKIVDSWKDSSKNLWKLINSGMSSNDKLGLGYEIHSNDEVLSVPPPLSGDYTPIPQEEVDDSLFVYGKKGPQTPEISVSDDKVSEHSSCQSNDNWKVTNEKDVSVPKSTEVAPSCVLHIKTPRQPLKDKETHQVDRKNWNDMMKRELGDGYSFTKKKCFCLVVVKSLIKIVILLKRKWQGKLRFKRDVNTGKDQLEDFKEFNGGSVTFGGSKGYISGKVRIRVGNLDFDSVSFVKELGHFNHFSMSQICDKQHKVLFTKTECLVVSSDFKMPDENQILLKVPRHHNMYSFDMKTPSPAKGFTCLIAKATSDESKLWHRRLGHINFKNLNKLVKGNLVRGLPSKVFKNDHTCVACHRGKQHMASCKAKLDRLITKPLHTLHMDLFGPTSVKSINHASYCLVITNDCTRSDNDTEFKNRDMLEFCGNKGIKQEYSNARTPQQNGVAERMNRTLIEAARTMLADSLLPTTFWAEAVSTACYIFNRVRVTKPQHKTPYELLFGL